MKSLLKICLVLGRYALLYKLYNLHCYSKMCWISFCQIETYGLQCKCTAFHSSFYFQVTFLYTCKMNVLLCSCLVKLKCWKQCFTSWWKWSGWMCLWCKHCMHKVCTLCTYCIENGDGVLGLRPLVGVQR